MSRGREIHNVVLSGGSYKGLSYIGVYQYLLERDMTRHIRNFVGVSIGAVFALLWFFEFSPKQMARIFRFIEWRRRHRIRSSLDTIPHIAKNYGLDDGRGFIDMFEAMLKRKTGITNITFKQLSEIYPMRTLRIGLFNISKCEFELAGADATPDMPISLALRISISLPVIFDPVEWRGDLWADGGVINNMPLEYFDGDMEHTIAFDFVCESELHLEPNSVGRMTLKYILGLMVGQNIYKKRLFKNSICTLRASHKTAMEEREVGDIFDMFRFEFTQDMINKYANIGYSDVNTYFSGQLTGDSEYSIGTVIRHLIWTAIHNNKPITFC